jgi:hypothetical protein
MYTTLRKKNSQPGPWESAWRRQSASTQAPTWNSTSRTCTTHAPGPNASPTPSVPDTRTKDLWREARKQNNRSLPVRSRQPPRIVACVLEGNTPITACAFINSHIGRRIPFPHPKRRFPSPSHALLGTVPKARILLRRREAGEAEARSRFRNYLHIHIVLQLSDRALQVVDAGDQLLQRRRGLLVAAAQLCRQLHPASR